MGKIRSEEEIAARKAKKQAAKLKKEVSKDAATQKQNVGAHATVKAGCAAAESCSVLTQEEVPLHSVVMQTGRTRRVFRTCDAEGEASRFPFCPEPADHCETSPEAYRDIKVVLELVAERLGKRPEKLRIYDPYYCSGAVKRHLNALGFKNVYNKCEDFYARLAAGAIPSHDVVVTNPPYSKIDDEGENHVARLIQFLLEDGKPFLLNMPEYVAKAGYYRRSFSEASLPWLLCPYKRYYFWTPTALKQEGTLYTKKDLELGFRCSRFAAMWYLHLEPVIPHRKLARRVLANRLPGIDLSSSGADEEQKLPPEHPPTCRLCRDLSELPEGVARRLAKKRRR